MLHGDVLPDDCNINTYADDALLMIYGHTIQNTETKCNECLRKIKEWGGKHGLSFNPNKTAAMLITNKLKFRDPVLTMDGTQLQLVNNFRYLGVILDRKLNFTAHIENVCGKAERLLMHLSRSFRPSWGLNYEVLKIIYRGAIEPILLYCSSVWENAANRRWGSRRLQRTQRNIAIRICKAYRTVSANAVILLSGFLPLELRARELSDIYKIKQSGETNIIGYHGCNYQKPLNFKDSKHPAIRHTINLIIENKEMDITNQNDYDFWIYTDGSKDCDHVGAGFVVLHNR